MLVAAPESRPAGQPHHLVERTISPILSAIRETDIAGWHKDRSTLGVVFAELGTADKDTILTALRTKMNSALHTALDAAEFGQIDLSFHWFPDDWKADDTGRSIASLYPDLVERNESRNASRAIKRAIDLLGASTALILLSPVLLATAIAIKLSSPGPVLFRQKRIGQYGVAFTCLKFRSMHAVNDSAIHREYITRLIAGRVDPRPSEGNGKIAYKITKDPRLTPIGHFIRKTSLDEVPQFFNVLRGQMSLVGPRPPIPYELDAYDIWHRRRLLEVKPGITGLWQVTGRSRLRFDEMVRLDLKYATTWSVWLDIKILVRTPNAVFSGEGAY
jgi:lipopolysaccharide/colanic/teichoic acid biosynthesis glycosyltransferase